MQERLVKIEDIKRYLQDKTFNKLSSVGEKKILIEISKDFNLDIKIDSYKEVIKKLETLKPKTGLLSNYYIEKEFKDKYNKSILVKEGIAKSSILWKSSDWDPCSIDLGAKRCIDKSTHERVCLLNNNQCVSRDRINIKPIETPEEKSNEVSKRV